MKKITPGHPLTQSPDMVKENIETLKMLFPTIVKEGKIDMEELAALLSDEVEDNEEYYRFTWAGKSMARREANKPSTATLRPDKGKSVNWDTTGNLFIEGDNLEVLKLLQKSYAGAVKMIYIDPPYNTGNDFVYNDDYSDNLKNYLQITGQINDLGKRVHTNMENSGRYHSNWLNMIYPRLKLSRNLLKDSGVIFLSIDDHEAHNLRKVCDEIFGEENFVANIIWQSRTSISNDQEVSLNHNHTLIYARNKACLTFLGKSLDATEYSNPDNDPRGPWKLVPLDANKQGGDTKYPIRNPNTGVEYLPPNSRSWTINSMDYKKLFDDNRIMFGVKGDSAPKRKIFLKERLEKGDSKTPSSIMLDAGTTKNGTEEIMELFDGEKIFSYPKPTSFIKRLIEFGDTEGEVVLDFFGGSGTTGHAIMQLNATQQRQRRFICVQLPEPTPIDSVAYTNKYSTISELAQARLSKASKALTKSLDKNLFKADKPDLGYKVFRLTTSNIHSWDGSPDKLEDNLFNTATNIREDRTEEDVLYEILLKYGLDLAQAIEERTITKKTVYNIGAGALFICLADGVTKAVAEGIGKWKEELNPISCKVIYKDTGLTDVEKTNSIQILKRYGITEVNSI
jgi:adenine-specific DNA-methyltransferase